MSIYFSFSTRKETAMRLGVCLIVICVLCACGAKPAASFAFPPSVVGVANPLQRELPVVRELTGQVEAIETVSLQPRIGGLIIKVLVKNGSEVKVGEPIVEIDPKPFVVALASAQAQVVSTSARLANSRSNLDRSRPLLAQKIISDQNLADLEATMKIAEGDLAGAQASVDAARLNLAYTHVTAPIAGRIGRVSTTVGNLVVAGGAFPGTTMTTIVSIDPVYVAFDLDEQTWREIGQHLRASGEATDGTQVPVDVQLEGEDGYPHKGAVAYADNQVDSASGSIRIHARFPNPDHSLTPGAFARIHLEVSGPRSVLLINDSALQSRLAMRYVQVVDEHGAVSFRPVVLGDHAEGALVVVESGLTSSERIAVKGLAKIFPGMSVSPQLVAMDTLEPLDATQDGAAPAASAHAADATPAAAATSPAAAPGATADAAKAPAVKSEHQ
jgi:RND family efflux transporter MFP subunit